ncbi:uncharacterized protein LOC105694588 [Orussus abietinus]|uniref:uncharacterized protein LOC105694588 n=1 Tax=Orussus abietinus TaxID=222816 RepID=UPI000625B219|nr:uncharacterized protein LOC105694588 [Orussus abietinus]
MSSGRSFESMLSDQTGPLSRRLRRERRIVSQIEFQTRFEEKDKVEPSDPKTKTTTAREVLEERVPETVRTFPGARTKKNPGPELYATSSLDWDLEFRNQDSDENYPGLFSRHVEDPIYDQIEELGPTRADNIEKIRDTPRRSSTSQENSARKSTGKSVDKETENTDDKKHLLTLRDSNDKNSSPDKIDSESSKNESDVSRVSQDTKNAQKSFSTNLMPKVKGFVEKLSSNVWLKKSDIFNKRRHKKRGEIKHRSSQTLTFENISNFSEEKANPEEVNNKSDIEDEDENVQKNSGKKMSTPVNKNLQNAPKFDSWVKDFDIDDSKSINTTVSSGQDDRIDIFFAKKNSDLSKKSTITPENSSACQDETDEDNGCLCLKICQLLAHNKSGRKN